MALQAVKISPRKPELMRGSFGRMKERWRVSSTDGTGTTVTITPDTRGRIESVLGNGNWFHNISANDGVPTSTGVLLTFAVAPAVSQFFDVDIDIRISA